jgi:hypothetical protein
MGGNGFTWIKIAFTMRLPQPFLDEKTHEKETGQKIKKGYETGLVDEGLDIEKGRQIPSASSFETELTNEEEELLEAWLENMDQIDDSWVRKLLGRGNQENMK